MVKYCPICGYPNPDDAIYCGKCGTKLPQSPQPANLSSPAQPRTAQQPPQQYPPQQPGYYPPPPPQGISTLDKVVNINRKFLAPFAGLLTGLEIILVGIGFILLFVYPFTQPGGAGPFSATLGTFIGALAIYTVIGLLVLVLGAKRSFSGSLPIMLGLMTFLYFLLLAVTAFLVYNEAKIRQLLTDGIELVIGSVFLLVGVLMGRPTTTVAPYYQQYYQQGPYAQYPAPGSGLPLGKIIAYVLGLVADILIYVGIGGNSKVVNNIGSLIGGMLPVDAGGGLYFGSSLAVVAGIIAPIGLIALALLNKSEAGKHASHMVLEVALLVFGVGQIIVGSGAVSNGLPNTSFLPGILVGSIYSIFAGGVIDLIAGILVLLLSILLMVEEALRLVKSASSYYTYQPPPPPPGGAPPSS